MIYKTLKKVSDYCQLLDKSKYHTTQTINGVTFTNNVDGTITVNGTSTSETTINFRINAYGLSGVKGHVYCILGCPPKSTDRAYYYLNTSFGYDYGKGNIVLLNRDIKGGNYYIYITAGYTANNLVFKPQLFDLTEMYGAGNEPTTVAEFREKFPNELYDYKPYSFLSSYKNLLKANDDTIITSYKKSLVCKTKNLFDYTTVSGLKNFREDDIPLNDFLIINGNSFTVQCATYRVNAYFTPSFILKAGTYTISLIAKGTAPGNNGRFGIVKFKSDGTLPTSTASWHSSNRRQSHTFTLDEDSEVALKLQAYGNVSNQLNLDSTFTDIMIELGDTATEYHPYGYL